ncbi:MAG TPA: dephospho-CoA kinase [Ignavibacteriaceae bacterium]|jgi:dephospho-CoA kinase
MKIRKLKVGITGNIGSGKSTFCDYLIQKGYPLINADELSKEILSIDLAVRSRIIKEFGEQAFLKNSVNTKYLAEKVFSNKQKLLKINSILHPIVLKKTDQLCEQYFSSNKNIVFIEAALIYEVKIEKQFDIITVIASDFEIRKQRIIKSGKFSAEQFEKRNSSQVDQDTKIKKADFVFYNNDSIEQLHRKAELYLIMLKSLTVN